MALTSQELQQEHLNEQLSKTPKTKEAKPVEPSKITAIDYNKQLQQLVRAIKRDIDRELLPVIKSNQTEYTTDSVFTLDTWLEDVTAVLNRLAVKWTGIEFDTVANQTAYQFVSQADQINKRKFDASMKAMGISVFSEGSAIDEMLQAAVYDNTQLIKSIPAQYLKQVESITLTNMRAGLRPSTIAKQLQKQFGVNERRARLIARDQSSKVNGDLNKKRQEQAGAVYFQWTTSKDSRVREDHTEIANKVTAYGKGIYRWDNPPLDDDGNQIIPGSPINCFPGNSKLDHTSLCNKLYRRWFTGELSELVFSDGVVLSTTANHPILTDKGFKAAHLINSGDNVIRTIDKGLDTIKLYGESVIPTFEQIFSAIDFPWVKHSVPGGLHSEFHGDVSDSDIDIVELNSLLVDAINPSIIEKMDKLDFSRSDKEIIFRNLTCLGSGGFFTVADNPSLGSDVSRLDLITPLILGHLTPLELFGFALGSWFDSSANYNSSDDVPGYVKEFSDCIFAFSVLVHGADIILKKLELLRLNLLGSFNPSLAKRSVNGNPADPMLFDAIRDTRAVNYFIDNIVDNRRINFSGHIYNLESVSNDYITNSTVVSNCRCVGVFVPERTVKANQAKGDTNPKVRR